MTQCRISGSINSGIRIINSLPNINSCSFTDNQAANGGGMYIVLDAVTEGLYLSGCKINTNFATGNGGGIWANLSAGSLTMYKCEINNNRTNSANAIGNYYGGGMYIDSAVAGLTLNDSKISGNEAYSINSSGRTANGQGGGAYLTEGVIEFTGCEISSNQTRSSASASFAYGGGIFINSGKFGGGIWITFGTVIAENCTIAYNNNEGIYNSAGILRVTNSIIYDNTGPSLFGTATVTYSDVLGGHDGDGNIDEFPDFIFAPIDLRLYPESPCVDAGNPAARYNECVPPSLGTVRNDMGAYGGPGACKYTPKCVGDLDGDGDCDGLDAKIFAGNLGRYDCDAHIPLLNE
jgi:hypothetical protein